MTIPTRDDMPHFMESSDNAPTLPADEELRELVRDASPVPFRGERPVYQQHDWQTTQVKGDYLILDKDGNLIAEIRRGGMGRKITEQEGEANAELFFLAPALAAGYLAQATALCAAREALEALRPPTESATGVAGTEEWCYGCREWLPHADGCAAVVIDKALTLLDPEAGLEVRPEVAERLAQPVVPRTMEQTREELGGQDASAD